MRRGRPASPKLPARKGESGQTLVLMTFFLVVLMAFVAVVIDGGMYFMQRRSIQGDADAAALAAVRELPASQGQAGAIAAEYAEERNAEDDATVEAINITENGTKIEVVVTTQGDSSFNELMGKSPPTIRTRATAKVQQTGALRGMLPMAFMRDTFTVGDNYEIKFDESATGNRGAVAPRMGGSCAEASGASDYRNLITGAAQGGIDACATPLLETIDTEPGTMSGPTRAGFDQRFGGSATHGDRYSTVVHENANDTYTILKPNSPRIGIVPVIEHVNGSNTWPTGRSQPVRILSYMLVYIGNRNMSGEPAYTDGGKSVWVTPLRAILPENFPQATDTFFEFDADSQAPVVYRLVD